MGRFLTSEWIIATYSARIPIMKDSKPKKNNTIVMIVAKPANGVPITNLRTAKTTMVYMAKPEQIMPNQVIKRSGKSENDSMPCFASLKTVPKFALETPPKRGGRGCGIPNVLKPTHANMPLTKRLFSRILRTASYTFRSTRRKSLTSLGINPPVKRSAIK